VINNNKNNFILKTKVDWVDYIGIYIIILILYILKLLITKSKFDFTDILILNIGIYFVHQLFLKIFILFDNRIIIKYTASFFLKNKYILIENIYSITILSNNSAFDPHRMIIKYKDGRKKIFFFIGGRGHQELIDEFRKLKIEVYVKSHIWK